MIVMMRPQEKVNYRLWWLQIRMVVPKKTKIPQTKSVDVFIKIFFFFLATFFIFFIWPSKMIMVMVFVSMIMMFDSWCFGCLPTWLLIQFNLLIIFLLEIQIFHSIRWFNQKNLKIFGWSSVVDWLAEGLPSLDK